MTITTTTTTHTTTERPPTAAKPRKPLPPCEICGGHVEAVEQASAILKIHRPCGCVV